MPNSPSIDEGYIKFQLHWSKEALKEKIPLELLEVRNLAHQGKWIGVLPEGIGYGNISLRSAAGFFISGTQTGEMSFLNEEHYSLVTKVSLSTNELWCQGLVKASSESISHSVFYSLNASIKSVLHVHNKTLWERSLDVLPTTGADVPYGTVEMANAISALYSGEEEGVYVMAGHEDGLFAFSESPTRSLEILNELA